MDQTLREENTDSGMGQADNQKSAGGDDAVRVEVRLLRALVADVLRVDPDVLSSMLQRAVEAEKLKERLGRVDYHSSTAKKWQKPLILPGHVNEEENVQSESVDCPNTVPGSSGCSDSEDKRHRHSGSKLLRAEEEKEFSVPNLCDQIGLTVFRQVCSESRSIQPQSPAESDYSVWTHRTSKWDIPKLAAMSVQAMHSSDFVKAPPRYSSLSSASNPISSQFEWSEQPGLPVGKDSIAGVCHVVQYKDVLVVATTIKCVRQGLIAPDTKQQPAGERHNLATSSGKRTSYQAALFVSDTSLRRWQPVATPSVVTSHVVDGLCVEHLRSKLFLVIRPCKNLDGPSTVWTVDIDGGLSSDSSWAPFCVVPSGHRCGSFAIIGNFFVAAGGKLGGGSSAAQRDVDAFDFNLGDWVSWPSLPTALYAAAPVVFNENLLVLCGGVQGQDASAVSDLGNPSVDQQETGRFESLSLDVHGELPGTSWGVHCYLKSPCLSPAAANIQGMLVVHNGGNSSAGDVAWWDASNREWRRITRLPNSCIDCAITEFGGNLVLIGGEEVPVGAAPSDQEICQHKFSSRVYAIKTVRRNMDVLCDRRKRGSESVGVQAW